MDSQADISLAKKVLGYTPKVCLKDGLREIIDGKRR
jgi:nucleoside-diphosphate-sugar epimerase